MAATMSPEEIVRFVLSWGRDEGEDGDWVDEDLAVNGWDDRNVDRCATDLAAALGQDTTAAAIESAQFMPDPEPTLAEQMGRKLESTGERIARMGREMIDPDYDPAREAAQDDPRGERDR
jgi:hypothetical protein